MLNVFEYLGAFQQGFGGNTAPVQTNTTQTFFFNNSGFESQLRCPDSCHISAGAASENYYVVCHSNYDFKFYDFSDSSGSILLLTSLSLSNKDLRSYSKMRKEQKKGTIPRPGLM